MCKLMLLWLMRAVLSVGHRFSQVMVVLTVVTISSSWLLTVEFGSVGLIWSNSINMLLRIIHRSRRTLLFAFHIIQVFSVKKAGKDLSPK